MSVSCRVARRWVACGVPGALGTSHGSAATTVPAPDPGVFLPRVYAGVSIAHDLAWLDYLLASPASTGVARIGRLLVSLIAAAAIFLVVTALGAGVVSVVVNTRTFL